MQLLPIRRVTVQPVPGTTMHPLGHPKYQSLSVVLVQSASAHKIYRSTVRYSGPEGPLGTSEAAASHDDYCHPICSQALSQDKSVLQEPKDLSGHDGRCRLSSSLSYSWRRHAVGNVMQTAECMMLQYLRCPGPRSDPALVERAPSLLRHHVLQPSRA